MGGEIVSKFNGLIHENLIFNLYDYFKVELLYKKVPKERGGKIVVQDVKDYLVKLQENFTQSSGKQQRLTDALNRFETTLSTQLPPERYNRIMNLVRVFSNLDATSEEIQSCLVSVLFGNNNKIV